jgi:MYXO-CTERM domain-containing protein
MGRLRSCILGLFVTGALSAADASAASYSATVLADNPLAYWRLGEGPGSTTAANLGTGGSAYDLTYRTPPSALPTLGVAGLLSGDSDTAMRLTNPINSSLQNQQYASAALGSATGLNFTTGSFSLEMWTRIDPSVNVSTSLLGLMSTGGGGATAVNGTPVAGGGNGYTLQVSNGSLRLAFHGAGAGAIYSAPITDLTGTRHLVVTFENGATNTARFYVDGGLIGTATGTADPLSATANLFSLGSFARAAGTGGGSANYGYSNGVLDEAAVYNTVLTDAQIASHYAAGIAPVPEPAATAAAGLAALAAVWVVRRRRAA